MSTDSKAIKIFWLSYLRSQGDSLDLPAPEASDFGDNPTLVDELGQLIKSGVKTATCSLLWEYEANDEKIPQVGELFILTDGRDLPLCIIETTEVKIREFDQIDERFAYDEGEGDRTLAYWREAHWRFFSRVCERIGKKTNPNMPLVCERFRLVYP